MLMQSMHHYQADLLTSFTSYHTDSLFDLEWLSSSSIISYYNTTTGTLFSKPISCYNVCKPEIDEYLADLARGPIAACLHNALEQKSDTAAQIEWASVVEALGFALADLRSMDSSSRVEHVLQNRLEAFWNNLADVVSCSSFTGTHMSIVLRQDMSFKCLLRIPLTIYTQLTIPFAYTPVTSGIFFAYVSCTRVLSFGPNNSLSPMLVIFRLSSLDIYFHTVTHLSRDSNTFNSPLCVGFMNSSSGWSQLCHISIISTL